mmetsp:Transcript_28669/g.69567  ORF Transcript_28669/g.69567 Transcript_28669/m.69567 type:complete len:541 (-) Transcript_28669:102-1724(-)|eukprot:CAMPEP_0113473876 /NCGR_PEP_ID=MMETSP0014_2-20120614/18280_1 /TAXON_ID=2857 /ORGANISM="Nitzschia sp." /LENGTH=540 /DNA_ID=CAMNT_0000366677 /DNA_START=160 /DNA_END=1782 /DNA_ORIENTATION=+ /assembly_acc=CAM_ASM_000159
MTTTTKTTTNAEEVPFEKKIQQQHRHHAAAATTIYPSPKSVVMMNPKAELMEPIHLPPGKGEGVCSPRFGNGDTTTTSILSKDSSSSNDNVNCTHVWPVHPASLKSTRTINPIRAIVDPIFKNIQAGTEREDGKDPISLALGDPTVGGNLPPCQVALDAVVETIKSTPGHAAGYVNACGTTEAREAIARYHSYPEHTIGAENVIVASGCSGSLEIVLSSLLDPGTSILVPQPGFPLYQVIAESHGASVVHYRLDPHKAWECDLNHLEELMLDKKKSNIRALLLNNPSNPTGAVFSYQHLQEVVAFCDKHHLVLVADEVYGDLTFDGCGHQNDVDNQDRDHGHDHNVRHMFYPMARVAAQCGQRVPVISTSGLAKQYLLPGWRVGWITFHDNIFGSLREVEDGAKRLAQVVLGTSHLVQTTIPKVLNPADSETMDEWKESLRRTLEEQAVVLCRNLSCCHGLEVVPPRGAMYSMVFLDLTKLDLQDDIDFSSRLLQEENVIVLPGTAFGCPNSFRVVFCSEKKVLEDAASRISNFCLRHAK